ncbi:MAG: choice-of-anchor tandem repeat NxxGxxAF-containing protein [Chthoniobacteraceae bacterium]
MNRLFKFLVALALLASPMDSALGNLDSAVDPGTPIGTPPGAMDDPLLLSPDGGSLPDIAIDSAGRSHVVWRGPDFFVYYAQVDAENNVSIPATRVYDFATTAIPRVAVDATGDAHIITSSLGVNSILIYLKVSNGVRVALKAFTMFPIGFFASESDSFPSIDVNPITGLPAVVAEVRNSYVVPIGSINVTRYDEELSYIELDGSGNPNRDSRVSLYFLRNASSPTYRAQHPDLSFDSSGTAHAVWYATDPAWTGASIGYGRIGDDFWSEIANTRDVYDLGGPEIARGELGLVEITWSTTGGSVIWQETNHDGVTELDDFVISKPGAVAQRPNIAAGYGDIFFGWGDFREATADIYVRSANGYPQTNISQSTGSAFNHAIGIRATSIAFVWQDNRNGLNQIFYRVSQQAPKLTFHQVAPDNFSNSEDGVGIDTALVPVLKRECLLEQAEVTEGLVADGVSPLLLQIRLPEAPPAPKPYRIRVESVSGNHLPSEIEAKLRLFDGSAWVPYAAGQDTVTFSPEDDPPVAFAYVEGLDASFIQSPDDGPEVTVELTVEPADGIGVPTTESFKICRPPVVLVHGYNTTGGWGANFTGALEVDRPPGFVTVIQYGVTTILGVQFATQNTYGSLSTCARLLDQQLESQIESQGSPLRAKWAFLRYDTVGHSQGGVLLRMLSSVNGGSVPSFRNAANANRGRFRRAVTIGSPHNGTRVVRYAQRLAQDANIYSAVPQFLVLSGLLQPKFDPWGDQISDLNAPGGRWTPDIAAKFLLVRTTVNDGQAPTSSRNNLSDRILGLNSTRGPVVFPQGSDGIVDLQAQGNPAGKVLTLPGTSNIAHAQPLSLFGASSDDVSSSEVAGLVSTVLKGAATSFGSFRVPPLLPTSERNAVEAAAALTLFVGNVIAREMFLPHQAQAAAPSASTYAFMLNPPADYPVEGMVVWNVDVFGQDGVTQDGVSLAVDSQDSRKVTVTVDAGVVGDVLLSAHYALADGGIAFATAVKVVSIAPPSATLTGIELDPVAATLPAGTSLVLHLWANYSDGSRLLVFPEATTVSFSSLTPATADVSPSGIVSLKAVGNATIEAGYAGQMAQAQFVVTPMETVPGGGSNDARLSALSVAGATLSPDFDAAVITYTTAVNHATASATVSVAAADAAASILQAPGNPVALNVGANQVQVKVTAEDGVATMTYSVTINRAPLAAPVHTTIFAKDNPAPDAGAPDGPPGDALLASFGVPAIDDDGHLAFTAKWNSATSGKGAGLFTDLAALALVGRDVPGITGATFKSFNDPVISAGNVACIATITGAVKGTVVIFGPATGPMTVLAQSGTTAPNADDAKFKSFSSVGVAGDAVGFLAQITGGSPKVTVATDTGLWLKDGAQPLDLALREGSDPLTVPIKTLVAFKTGNGSPGAGRGWVRQSNVSWMLALATYTDRTPIVLQAGNGVGKLNNDTNAAGEMFASFGLPTANAIDDVAFLAKLAIGPTVTKANASGIFMNSMGGDFATIARVGQPAGATGANFKLLKDPILSDDGGLTFPATITAKGTAATTLWWQPSGGAPMLIAQGGADAADLPGAKWKTFPSLAIATNRGPIFTATLVPNRTNVTAKSASGVWACDFNGAPRLLFRTGLPDEILLGKTLKSFTLLNATKGSMGVTRGYNAAQQVVWLATFTDKTTAIVVTEVP